MASRSKSDTLALSLQEWLRAGGELLVEEHHLDTKLTNDSRSVTPGIATRHSWSANTPAACYYWTSAVGGLLLALSEHLLLSPLEPCSLLSTQTVCTKSNVQLFANCRVPRETRTSLQHYLPTALLLLSSLKLTNPPLVLTIPSEISSW